MADKPRNYGEEYKKFHSSDKAKKDRAARNQARSEMEKAGKVKKGQDVDHADGNPRNNSKSNLRAMSVKKNRGRNNNKNHNGKKK